jgi:hypothetical protein
MVALQNVGSSASLQSAEYDPKHWGDALPEATSWFGIDPPW